MKQKNWIIVLTLVAFMAMLFENINVNADPSGAVINFNSSSMAAAIAPGNRSDVKGTINTIKMATLQQDTKWKAYVGNVSGTLTLDDANSYTIYDWRTISAAGQVYATRTSTVTWSSVACINHANLTAEQNALGMSSTAVDNIENTFNWTGHNTFKVGTTSITGCNSTVTYKNDTNPGQTAAGPFQEVLLTDGVGAQVIYTALVNASKQGYRNDSLYDFQMIVAENATAGSPTALTYFFYLELS